MIARADAITKALTEKLEAAAGKVSLTFDGWSSAIMKAYIAVTVHYIDEDWELQADLLAFEELEGSHTGENLAEVLYTILETHRLKRKVCTQYLPSLEQL